MNEPTLEQIANAIEILSMCEPIKEVQGGMWFGGNFDMADATFVDYGACRAFAVAARALPVLVKRQDALVKALKNARNCIDTLIVNSPDKKKRRNLGEFIREIDGALETIKETV